MSRVHVDVETVFQNRRRLPGLQRAASGDAPLPGQTTQSHRHLIAVLCICGVSRTAQNSEDQLDKKGRLDEALIDDMGEVIKMAQVIAFKFKAGAVSRWS